MNSIDGLVVTSTRKICQQVELDDVAINILFISEGLRFAGFKFQGIEQERSYSIDGVALPSGFPKQQIDIQAHGMRCFIFPYEFRQERNPPHTDNNFDPGVLKIIYDSQQLQ